MGSEVQFRESPRLEVLNTLLMNYHSSELVLDDTCDRIPHGDSDVELLLLFDAAIETGTNTLLQQVDTQARFPALDSTRHSDKLLITQARASDATEKDTDTEGLSAVGYKHPAPQFGL